MAFWRSKWFWLVIKVTFGVTMLAWVVHRQLIHEGMEDLQRRLGALQGEFFALAVGMQLCAVACAVARWRILLLGQGIRAPIPFLLRSFLIGRFFGAFTPGGLGLDGWRLFDVGKRTSRYASVTAVAGVEILGQLAFGVVVMLGSLWGYRILGVSGVLLLNGFFALLVTAGVTVLSRPRFVLSLLGLLPQKVRSKIDGLVQAVVAYQGRTGLLAQAVLLGVGVHVFNNLIYVSAAFALAIDLNPLVIFFASSLQIMVTLLPVSLNGLGLREVTATALYTSAAVGLSRTDALLIPLVGIAAEYVVSLSGVVPFVFRDGSRDVGIVLDPPATPSPAATQEGDAGTPLRRAASLG